MKHTTYMAIVASIAAESKCARNKVGAIIVKNDSIIAVGYNGTPRGFNNKCEDCNGMTKKEVIHAELNAVLKCARDGISCEGATLYTTLSPCIDCAKMLVQSGIKTIIYEREYRLTDGIELLRQYIEIYQCDDSI